MIFSTAVQIMETVLTWPLTMKISRTMTLLFLYVLWIIQLTIKQIPNIKTFLYSMGMIFHVDIFYQFDEFS